LQVNYIQVTLKQHENLSLYSFACVYILVDIKTTNEDKDNENIHYITRHS
jgi:hypothetical protein